MKLSTSLNTPAYSSRTSVDEAAAFVVEAERLGVDTVWTAEAWGTDAFTPLAHVAALTERIKLATGIVQISARAPVMTAMTAMTLDVLSGGRMVLGLGVSGPQVVEGLHGQRYDRPLERLREYVEVLRLAFAGERLEYSGNQTVLPLSGGEGKALRLALKPNPRLPIHLATLGPRAMELCGEIADGWVATCFVPERSGVYIDALARGAERAGRSLTEIAIDAGGPLAFSDDVGRLVQSRKKALAFQLSAMGSPKTNFYNMAYSRMGYEDVAQEVRKLWLDAKRDDAVAAVPDELAASTSLFGTREMVRDRMRAYRDAGVTTLRIDPMGREPSERLAALEQAIDVAREVTAAI